VTGVTYTNAVLSGGAASGVDWALAKPATKASKQAATRVAARFLYMVVLYMAPENTKKKPAGARA
jgi:hypothetical protein